jgi:hypothetical protein
MRAALPRRPKVHSPRAHPGRQRGRTRKSMSAIQLLQRSACFAGRGCRLQAVGCGQGPDATPCRPSTAESDVACATAYTAQGGDEGRPAQARAEAEVVCAEKGITAGNAAVNCAANCAAIIVRRVGSGARAPNGSRWNASSGRGHKNSGKRDQVGCTRRSRAEDRSRTRIHDQIRGAAASSASPAGVDSGPRGRGCCRALERLGCGSRLLRHGPKAA